MWHDKKSYGDGGWRQDGGGGGQNLKNGGQVIQGVFMK